MIFLPKDAPLISEEELYREIDREVAAELEHSLEYKAWLDRMTMMHGYADEFSWELK